LKVLVTGANGMLGSSLCHIYHNRNKVFAFHRDLECLTPCFESYSLQLTDAHQFQLPFKQIRPDLVIHCAGLTNVEKCEKDSELAVEANVNVVENIARSCSAETKLVYLSTDQVYGKTTDYSEDNDDLHPVNQYGKTKLLGEKKVQEFCSDYIIIRTNIFGWNVKPKKISSAEWMYNSLKKGDDLPLFKDYTFSPIYTGYLGEILMQLIEMDFKGIINVGSLNPCSKYEFGIKLAEEFSFDKSCIRKGSISDYKFLAPRCNKLDLNISKMYFLGLKAPDYVKSLKKFRQYKPYN